MKVAIPMGVYYDYYRAPDRTTAVTALEWGPLGTQPGAPVFDAADVKNIDPIVMLRTLQSLLTGVPDAELPDAELPDAELPDAELIAGDEEGHLVAELPEQLRDALADAEQRRLREVAERWVLTEEFWQTTADDVLSFLHELIALARRGQDSGQLLYCWF